MREQPAARSSCRATESCAATDRSASTAAAPRPSRPCWRWRRSREPDRNLRRRPSPSAVDRLDWQSIAVALDDVGVRAHGSRAEPAECRSVAELYDDDARFRSTIDMARHRFGEGQYRYFDRPLPERRRRASAPRSGRTCCPSHATGPAGSVSRRRGPTSSRSGSTCATRPVRRGSTPLLLRYGPGDWNALHRDLYGELVFPLQVVVALDEPGVDFTGGEFVMVEQRPRAQSRATVTTIGRGHALVFTTRDRPVRSARGWSAAPMRHGVSVLRSGRRRALGLVFHDAK